MSLGKSAFLMWLSKTPPLERLSFKEYSAVGAANGSQTKLDFYSVGSSCAS